jgi:SPW repeat
MENRYSWQDFLSLYLGAWAFLTPRVIGRPAAVAVIASYIIVSVLISFFAIVGLVVFRPWPECVNIVLGGGLMASPWLLGFEAIGSLMRSALLIGTLVIICSAWSLSEKQSREAPAE